MPRSRDLTQGAVWRRLLALAAPMVIGIVAVLSINLADTFFVGRLGTDPLAALSFTFPVTLTITSLSIGLGAGAASVVSRAVGAGDRRDAQRLSTDSLVLALLIVALVCVAGLVTIRPLFSLIGADGEVLDLIEGYMRIWYYSMPFLVVPMVANAIIRSVGDAFWPSAIMVVAALVNIALTPLFVFGFGPIPALGIEGAAWGTFWARALTLIMALVIVIGRERLVTLAVPPPAEIAASWARVTKIGVPAAVGNMVNPLTVAVVTAFVAAFGDVVVAAFGVATRIESFASIPMLALSAAIGPVAGQNWGAGKIGRVRQALVQSYGVCFVWSILLGVVFWAFAEPVARLFASGEPVTERATLYLTIVPITLFGYGVTIVAAGCFNALGKSVTGLGYYLFRGALFYVPLSWLAARMAGPQEVFIAIAMSNVIAGILITWYSLRWLKRREDRG